MQTNPGSENFTQVPAQTEKIPPDGKTTSSFPAFRLRNNIHIKEQPGSHKSFFSTANNTRTAAALTPHKQAKNNQSDGVEQTPDREMQSQSVLVHLPMSSLRRFAALKRLLILKKTLRGSPRSKIVFTTSGHTANSLAVHTLNPYGVQLTEQSPQPTCTNRTRRNRS